MPRNSSQRRRVPKEAPAQELSLFEAQSEAMDAFARLKNVAGAQSASVRARDESASDEQTSSARPEVRGQKSALPRRRRSGAGRAESARYLLEGETRLDATTAQMVSQLSGLRWPRKWSAIRRYDLLEAAEIQRLRRQSDAANSPLLAFKTRAGQEVVALSARGEEELIRREGARGFRRVMTGESGAKREYFIKHLTTADGYIETRLSWFGAAWPLFAEASDKVETGFQAFLAQQNEQRSLFEELDAAERERADARLRLMESVRNGRLVLDYLMRTFGRDGVNPVRVAAWDLRALLGCENDAHGMRRVRGCLEALSEIRFEMHLQGGAQKARSFGALISEVQYFGSAHGSDGWFAIHLAPSALGCLAVFGVEAQLQQEAPRTIATTALHNESEFDWQRSLSPAERERLKSGFTRSQLALAPHYDRAHDLSPEQAELLRWIERQLTQQRDASRFRGTLVTPGDRTPRLYSQVFCPALPAGRTFLGALGHFRDRPERGRKLASLAREIGLLWPAPRAKTSYQAAVQSLIDDLRLIVEEVLDGMVVVCLPKSAPRERDDPREWLPLSAVSSFAPDWLAANGYFLCFISPDYGARLIEKLENYYQERFERGDSPYLIKVRRAGLEGPSEARKPHSLIQQLRVTRDQSGLTQSQVGQILGVSQAMVNKWESGRAPVSAKSAAKIETWLQNLKNGHTDEQAP